MKSGNSHLLKISKYGHSSDFKLGFTIVELLVVIVVIGILAAITIISYTGIQQKATVASLVSDLDNASKLLKLDQVVDSVYPATLAAANGGKGIPASANTTYDYTVSNSGSPSFCITATKDSTVYSISSDGPSLTGPCPVLRLDAGSTLSYSGTGSNWFDLSGNNNNATLNSATYTTNNLGVISFDGVNSTVSVPDNNSLDFGTGDFTLGFWCYRTATGYQGGSYIVKGGLVTSGFNTFDDSFRADTTTGELAAIGLSAAYNVWQYHVLVVNQNTSPYIKHYINGVLNQTNYVEVGNIGTVSNSSSLIIGRSNAGGVPRYYNGSIGNVQLYNKSLSVLEINQNFNALRGRYGI